MFQMTMRGPADKYEVPGSTSPEVDRARLFTTGDQMTFTQACPAGQVLTEFGCQGKPNITEYGDRSQIFSCPPGQTWTGSGCLITNAAPPAAPTPNVMTMTPPSIVDQPTPGMMVTATSAVPSTMPAPPFGIPWWKLALGAAGILGGALVISRLAR